MIKFSSPVLGFYPWHSVLELSLQFPRDFTLQQPLSSYHRLWNLHLPAKSLFLQKLNFLLTFFSELSFSLLCLSLTIKTLFHQVMKTWTAFCLLSLPSFAWFSRSKLTSKVRRIKKFPQNIGKTTATRKWDDVICNHFILFPLIDTITVKCRESWNCIWRIFFITIILSFCVFFTPITLIV